MAALLANLLPFIRRLDTGSPIQKILFKFVSYTAKSDGDRLRFRWRPATYSNESQPVIDRPGSRHNNEAVVC
jgi:hypothetical protein